MVKQFSFGAFYKPINMFNQAWEKYSSVLLNLKYWGVNPRRLISNNVMSRLRDRSHPGIFCLKHFLPGKFYGGEKINYRVLQSALTRVLTDLKLEVYPKWILSTKPWNLASCFVLTFLFFYCKSSMKYWSQCSLFGRWEFRNVSSDSPGTGNETSWPVCDHQ